MFGSRKAALATEWPFGNELACPALVRRASRRGIVEDGYRADRGHLTTAGGAGLQMSDV